MKKAVSLLLLFCSLFLFATSAFADETIFADVEKLVTGKWIFTGFMSNLGEQTVYTEYSEWASASNAFLLATDGSQIYLFWHASPQGDTGLYSVVVSTDGQMMMTTLQGKGTAYSLIRVHE